MIDVPIAYSWIIAREISATRCRSLDAPVGTAPNTISSAERLIAAHRDKLDELAAALLRNELLERDDIERIMAGTRRFKRGAGGLRVVAAEGDPPITDAQ